MARSPAYPNTRCRARTSASLRSWDHALDGRAPQQSTQLRQVSERSERCGGPRAAGIDLSIAMMTSRLGITSARRRQRGSRARSAEASDRDDVLRDVTQVRVVLEVDARPIMTIAGRSPISCACDRLTEASMPLRACSPAISRQRTHVAIANHQFQTPAVTLTFDLVPGAFARRRGAHRERSDRDDSSSRERSTRASRARRRPFQASLSSQPILDLLGDSSSSISCSGCCTRA